ncbi:MULTISPECIES: hypothetical protein [Bacillus]|uniref:hypothetical protein n=1 Tax=Bacillus TaxID=1386 RepID=UPI0001A07276|nr:MULTISPECIES: hypothetical protein [Bacillus]EEL22889.1 hypothetical protein bcere0017_23360 [Bacillus cereus Rock1-3]EEL34441.1 hypothetical protein bcere0019_22950 [Bacillus cereus Rock3-28]EEL40225.1 hypothetical protein bcere0020_23290 [Bacillus cereus Rock3-29]MBJ7949767.1 hypothetical protein [Bacillus cereus group sp. N24]MCU5181450.1 hypothetical protein [Bacillus toyonensis]
MYQGDHFITEGTIVEVSEKANKSLYWLQCMIAPSYEKVCGNSIKRLRLIRIDNDEE